MCDLSERRTALRRVFAEILDGIRVDRAMGFAREEIDRAMAVSHRRPSGRTFLIAIGKAALPMGQWVLDRESLVVDGGLIVSPSDERIDRQEIVCIRGGHPIPDRGSVLAGESALELCSRAGETDRVLFLLSGGGSALCESPAPTIGIDDLRATGEVLVSCGAGIVEINAVRKRISRVKGGRLAQAAHPAAQITAYVSDVPAGEESSIASGPTMPDETRGEDVERVIDRYGLDARLPASVLRVLSDASLPGPPRKGDPCFSRSHWICVLDNRLALEAAAAAARSRGWLTQIDTSVDDIDVTDATEALISRLRALRSRSGERPACVVSGGELSSPVRGDGTGGRNQAFALECVRRIGGEPISVLSAGTDGIDGNSPAAGAIADGTTVRRARSLGMDPEEFSQRSDSHTFFHRLGDDITCGSTGNNVRDVRVLVAWS